MFTPRYRFALVGLFICCVGCGPQVTPTAKVTGTVTYKGQPLASGAIAFLVEGGRAGYGKIVNGEIKEVTTTNENDGAPVGKCTITIQSFEESGSKDMYATPKSLIPEKYGSPEKSGLTAEIKRGGPNELKFDLKDE